MVAMADYASVREDVVKKVGVNFGGKVVFRGKVGGRSSFYKEYLQTEKDRKEARKKEKILKAMKGGEGYRFVLVTRKLGGILKPAGVHSFIRITLDPKDFGEISEPYTFTIGAYDIEDKLISQLNYNN